MNRMKETSMVKYGKQFSFKYKESNIFYSVTQKNIKQRFNSKKI